MKTLFIPAKIKLEINGEKISFLKLPKYIAIAYSIQYEDLAFKVKKILSKNHKITKITQVLGCSKPSLPRETQVLILLSDGKFHAISLAIETKLPVYILEDNKIKEIPKEEIENFKRKQKAFYLKFLNSRKVGILISIKPGQENLKKALEFKKKLKNKKSYLFLGNEINSNEFENFPSIELWINTACPRLDMDINLININEIKIPRAKALKI